MVIPSEKRLTRYTIVGIDAGINAGYAILDLNGSLISSGCVKGASDESMVGIITKEGTPVLIAADTAPPSHFVRKVAARLNTKLFVPSESLSKIEKREIGSDIDDPHIRDSYAAAVKAYRRYMNRLRQIEGKDVTPRDKEELKRMAIEGERLSDAEIIHI